MQLQKFWNMSNWLASNSSSDSSAAHLCLLALCNFDHKLSLLLVQVRPLMPNNGVQQLRFKPRLPDPKVNHQCLGSDFRKVVGVA